MGTFLFTPLAIFIPAIIAIISWVYNAKKMRELEEFKMRFSERLKVRIEMLKSLIVFKVTIEQKKYLWDKEINNLLSIASVNFQLYGETDEQRKMEDFTGFIKEMEGKSLLSENEKERYKVLLLALVNTTLNSLRKELDINS